MNIAVEYVGSADEALSDALPYLRRGLAGLDELAADWHLKVDDSSRDATRQAVLEELHTELLYAPKTSATSETRSEAHKLIELLTEAVPS